MKRSFLFLALGLLTATSVSFASNYPPDYCQQNVRIQDLGHGLIAQVSSGCGTELVLGYRNSGPLAQNSPEKIDAILVSRCRQHDGSAAQKTTTVTLGKEWHGAGYMSAPFYLDACPYSDSWEKPVVGVAFSDGRGRWDSNYGRNYAMDLMSLGGTSPRRSQDVGPGIGLNSWNILIDALRTMNPR